jgi:hypothetical protein
MGAKKLRGLVLYLMAVMILGGVMWQAAPNAASAQGVQSAPLQITVHSGERLGPIQLRGLMAANWANVNDQSYYALLDSGLVAYRHRLKHDMVNVTRRDGCAATDGSCLDFDFTAFDAHYNEFTGTFPLSESGVVVISGTPRALSSQPDAADGAFWAYAPASWEEWTAYIRAMVTRRVEKFGLAGAQYLIGDEPDDMANWRGTPETADTLPAFLTLYVETAFAIKAVDPSALVGGPGVQHWGDLGRNAYVWGLAEFLRGLKAYPNPRNAAIPLDLIDWHDYAQQSTQLADGVASVDALVSELGFAPKPAYVISAWNRARAGNCGTHTPLQVASHAAHNLIREAANPSTHRLSQAYWSAFELEQDCPNVALMVMPESSPAKPEYCLRPLYAVYQMLTEMKVGDAVRVDVPEPLVGVATRYQGDRVFLALNNNSAEALKLAITFSNVTLEEPLNRTVYRVNEEFSSDCMGLELGRKTRIELTDLAHLMEYEIPAYGSLMVVLARDSKYW